LNITVFRSSFLGPFMTGLRVINFRTQLMSIFVFGSNLAGRHGKGAALHARRNCGAIYGQGTGRQGQSYAIPTKDKQIRTLPLYLIAAYVGDFLFYANSHPELQFVVTRIGCGLAGYRDEQIAPMFKGAPSNCRFDPAWAPYL
jgi:hypothetical protein